MGIDAKQYSATRKDVKTELEIVWMAFKYWYVNGFLNNIYKV